MDRLQQRPAEVVLIPRRRGNLVEYATPSIYSGGSAAASPHQSQDGHEVTDLREAIADKDLLIMELREEKAQLQFDSNKAEGSWQAALQHKDQAIQQLSEALQSKEQALVALSQRDAAWQRSPSQTAHGQRAHDHDMEQLRSQLAEHNATIAALRARLTGDSIPQHSSSTPVATQASHQDISVQPGVPGQRSTAEHHHEVDFGRVSSLSLVPQAAVQPTAEADGMRRAAQRSTAEQSGTPRSRRSDAENAAQGWPGRPPLQPVANAARLQGEATFHPAHAPPPAHSTPRSPPRADTVSSLRHELLANVRRAQEAVGQLPQEGRRGEARLQGLLREQEALLQGVGDGEPDDGFGERFRGVLEERLREASTRTHILSMENEELEARLAAAQDSCGELRAALQERESTALEQQLEADALRARLADLSGPPLTGSPRKGGAGYQGEQLRQLQERLVARDAAAKKYKDGCRSLKERCEHLEQTCQKLKGRNEELARAAAEAPVAAQGQEREARELVAQAQRDVERSRKQAAKADAEKRSMHEQVQELQAELRAALADQEAVGKRAEEQVEEERSRAARALRQRSEEADWRAAEREAEAATALARAEKLRQAAADCEAAATRKVEAANESTRVAETRLAEAREEASRLQQRLMAAEEAAGRDARKLETLARDVRAEQQHAEATLERLERAHARVQQLEGQVAAADDTVARYKEEKREVAATLEDLKFRVSQAERRGKQEVLSSAKLQQRLEDAAQRAAKAEATAEEAWQAASAHEAGARDAEGRRSEAEAAAQAAEARCQGPEAGERARVQELGSALQQSDTEKAHLRDTLVRTEALIKQARHEHAQDLQDAAASARAEYDALQRHAHDLQLKVDSERAARERAEAAVQEAHAALEQHKGSMEQSHAQGLKAAASLQTLKERFKAKQAELHARDDTIRELHAQLTQLQTRFQRQLAAKDSLLRQREVEVAELAEKEGQLRAAQARLAQVAPIMRRIAAHGGAPAKHGM